MGRLGGPKGWVREGDVPPPREAKDINVPEKQPKQHFRTEILQIMTMKSV